MTISSILSEKTKECLKTLYGYEADESAIQISKTKKEFEGDLTLVVFPFLKAIRRSPVQAAQEIGAWLVENTPQLRSFNVIQGFLNLSIAPVYWLQLLDEMGKNDGFGYTKATETSPLVMVEYSSPNTNKPLHLGHIRNNLLGYSLSRILEANGMRVVKTNIVNDRGIHICKSMLAWKKWFDGATPQSTGKKGDHLVGDCYVAFDKHFKEEVRSLLPADYDQLDEKAREEAKAKAEAASPLMQEAHAMLRDWEAGKPEVRALWETMNQWVYAGFDETYRTLGVSFDKIYYESNTYLLGKDKVLEGLEKGLFFRKDDGSVWADLQNEGLDQKVLLRSDGTSVYMTQDIGTANLRFQEFPIDKMVYVVGNEQNYHFKVLSILLDRLGFAWGKDLVHFSYGMVELPEGKMKSREGTVVDADDLVEEMFNTSRETSRELGKLDACTPEEAEAIVRMVGLGALKYFILKVDPKRTMTFNPKESIDFNGNTGPFIQYAYARIQSVLRKAGEQGVDFGRLPDQVDLSDKEQTLIQHAGEFPEIVRLAGDTYSPAVIANYVYDLVKEYNQFYHDFSILREEDLDKKVMRLYLSRLIGDIIRKGMFLLGIDVPSRM